MSEFGDLLAKGVGSEHRQHVRLTWLAGGSEGGVPGREGTPTSHIPLWTDGVLSGQRDMAGAVG